MKSRLVVRLVLSVGLLAGIGAVSGSAGACGDEVAPAIDHRIMGVARAEKDLRDGKYMAAAGSVLRMMPHVRTSKPGKDPLFARGLRTLAVAVARADGQLPLDKEVPDFVLGPWSGKKVEDKQANLAWAVNTLTILNEQKKDDPGVKTDLAEALARVDGRQDDALKILNELADKDLITSAEGYAALAELRDRAGDQPGRQAAATRCESMTKTPAICGAQKAPASGQG